MADHRHAARRGSHRAPSRAVGPWEVEGAITAVVGRVARVTPSSLMTPVAALVAATAFVAGSVTQVTWSQLEADALRVQQEAIHQAAVEAQGRHDAASTSRLSAQATAYLAHRRTEALALADTAVLAADTLASDSQKYLDEDERGQLDAALAELTALLDETPDAETALDAALAAVVPAPEPVEPEPAEVSPIEPLADAVEMLAAPTRTEASALLQADGVDVATTEAARASDLSTPATPATTVSLEAAPVEQGATGATGTTATVVLAGADLALSDSERLVAAAERVLELSAEVEAVVEERVAEEEAQERAEARAAKRAADLEAIVAAADASPNGAIPKSYLCGVDFQSGVALRCDAAAALEDLNEAYRRDTGSTLTVVSSYRTTAQQALLVEEKGDLAAAPGTSNHGRGLAIDVAGAGSLGEFDAPLYLWLTANAADHGWHHPSYMDPGGAGPLEPWHWEFDTGT